MELKTDAMWSMVVPTSIGLRLTAENRMPTHQSDRFLLQATSAETNVATIAAFLGEPAKLLTAFVAESPFALFIKQDLRSRGLAYEGPEIPQGNPWGPRHQINVADSGFGGRGPRVWNDRAGEVARELSINDFDVDRLFGEEGVKILHLSGLFAAISPSTSELCVELAKAAKRYGTRVSMDMNHRASFWAGREDELHQAFHEIASLCDVLIGNEEDFQLTLGIEGPEAGGKDVKQQIQNFTEMIDRIRASYPKASWIATTLREVVNANEHHWGMIVSGEGVLEVIEPRPIQVMDRIGGGDGSVGGLLYGIIKGWEPADCAHFGWATGALAAGSIYDYAAPADEAQVWAVWAGNARVSR